MIQAHSHTMGRCIHLPIIIKNTKHPDSCCIQQQYVLTGQPNEVNHRKDHESKHSTRDYRGPAAAGGLRNSSLSQSLFRRADPKAEIQEITSQSQPETRKLFQVNRILLSPDVHGQ